MQLGALLGVRADIVVRLSILLLQLLPLSRHLLSVRRSSHSSLGLTGVSERGDDGVGISRVEHHTEPRWSSL